MSEIQGLGAPDTSPEKAIPISTPTTPRTPDIPFLKTVQSYIPFYVRRLDRTISHLNRILAKPAGTDTLLLTICYTTLTASTVLSSVSLHALRSQLTLLLSAVRQLPKNTTIIISDSAIRTPRLLLLSQRLKALSALISDFRIFVRLWGLLSIWAWAKGLVENPPEDEVQRRIAWSQVAVNVAYQYLENGAYLASKGVLGWSPDKQTKAWVWSSRFWMAHVGLEFVRLAYEWSSVTEREEKGKALEGEKAAVAAKWRREAAVNIAYAPLTLHWSLEQGLVSDFWVGALGSVAGIVGFTQLWRNTAE